MSTLDEIYLHIPEGIKVLLDGLSLLTLVGTLAQLLPSIATFTTIVWTLLRVYESKTARRLMEWWRSPAESQPD